MRIANTAKKANIGDFSAPMFVFFLVKILDYAVYWATFGFDFLLLGVFYFPHLFFAFHAGFQQIHGYSPLFTPPY
jgi:hypothetical protein